MYQVAKVVICSIALFLLFNIVYFSLTRGFWSARARNSSQSKRGAAMSRVTENRVYGFAHAELRLPTFCKHTHTPSLSPLSVQLAANFTLHPPSETTGGRLNLECITSCYALSWVQSTCALGLELRWRTAPGYVPILSRDDLHLTLWGGLPEGRGLKKEWAGWEGSPITFSPFHLMRVAYIEATEGRSQPIMFDAVRTTL